MENGNLKWSGELVLDILSRNSINNKVRITYDEIVTQSFISKSTVTRKIKELVEKGYITRIKDTSDSKNVSNIYTIIKRRK